jgi:drug/metabolite transporter (DMT)-like permease
MASDATSLLGPLAAFGSSVTWAIGVIAYSKLSEKYPAYLINFTRLLVGTPFFLLIFLLSDHPLAKLHATEPHHLLWSFSAVMASYAFGDSLFLMASRHIGAPGALAIASIYPLWSALGGIVFKGEILSLSRSFGILIIIASTIAVILSGHRGAEVTGLDQQVQEAPKIKRFRAGKIKGPLLAIACSLCWALNSLSVSRLGVGIDAIYANLLRFLMGLVLCPLIGILLNGRRSFRWILRKDFVRSLPSFAIECTGGPLFYVYGLSHSALAIGATLSSLAPVLSVPMALALGREKFSAVKTAGVLGVIAGAWLLF